MHLSLRVLHHLLHQNVSETPLRRETPAELLRLMGFKDFEIAVDDNAMWRQTGNSIAVPVLKAVFQSIFDTLKTSRVDPLKSED